MSAARIPPPSEAQDWFLAALNDHGPAAMFVICLASCIALPVPASLAMLSAGALSASGELPLWQIAFAALAGALIGDQIAFAIGRAGRGPLTRWIDAREARRAQRIRAEDWLRHHGGPGILFSRWPVSPLGPYINFAAGAAAFGWARFTAWAAPGEGVWVAVNIGAGYLLSDQITGIAYAIQEATGLTLAVLCVVAIFWGLRRLRKRPPD